MNLLYGLPDHKTITKSLKQELFKRQGGKCMYCGRKPGCDLLEGDYKNPHSKGGSSKKQNYQLLCGTCNKRKGASTDRQFRTRYKATGVPQVQKPPAQEIPQAAFEKVAKQIADTKAKRTAKKQQANQLNPLKGLKW